MRTVRCNEFKAVFPDVMRIRINLWKKLAPSPNDKKILNIGVSIIQYGFDNLLALNDEELLAAIFVVNRWLHPKHVEIPIPEDLVVTRKQELQQQLLKLLNRRFKTKLSRYGRYKWYVMIRFKIWVTHVPIEVVPDEIKKKLNINAYWEKGKKSRSNKNKHPWRWYLQVQDDD